MRRFLAYFLAGLVLLQSLGRELLVLEYAVNKARITERYCVNKARPALHCNGQCYLAKQLRRAAERDSKAPESAWAKLKFEALPPGATRLPVAATAWPTSQLRYARLPVPLLAGARLEGVFRPPVFGS